MALLDRARALRKRLLPGDNDSGMRTASAEAEAVMADIVHEVRLCDQSYYGVEPVVRVRDEEYDELVMHLAELERVFPQLTDVNSPTVTVGSSIEVDVEEKTGPQLSVEVEDEVGDVPRNGVARGQGTISMPRFASHRHAARMLSLGNAYDRADVTAFLARVEKLEQELQDVSGFGEIGSTVSSVPGMCVEAKVDGVALSISFRGGKLVAAATRGDGDAGDDVTANVRAALIGRGVPTELPEDVDVDVRGEVYISADDFAEVNAELGTEKLANARNAAAGGLKHKEPSESARRKLRFVAYECLRIPGDIVAAERTAGGCGRAWGDGATSGSVAVSYWPTQVETLCGLAGWGLGAMNVYKLCQTEDDIVAFALEQEIGRAKLPFEADGVVIKVNDSGVRHALGNTAKSPRGAIAFKFGAVGAQTVVESVDWQVSRTGTITPIAVLEPVEIGGVTVRRATLHNYDEILRLDLCVGDTVLVQRGGDVIPKIKMVKEKAEAGLRKTPVAPSMCPSCGGPVEVGSVPLEATTVSCMQRDSCAAQTRGRLQHFARRDAMDISGLGPQTISKLLESGLVSRLADLFSLTVESIGSIEGFKEKSSRSLYASIQAARGRSLERVIVGFGIPGVGLSTARNLAECVQTVGGLRELGQGDGSELLSLPTVADVSRGAIIAFLRETWVQEELAALAEALAPASVADFRVSEAVLESQRRKDGDDAVAGKTFAFTGKMDSMSRIEAGKRVKTLGGETSSTLTKRTDYLVAGRDAGSKVNKAARIRVQVISEIEFLDLLGDVE